MKSFVAACLVAIVIAAGGALLLNHFQESAAVAYSTSGARV
jgi:hypothetical protein